MKQQRKHTPESRLKNAINDAWQLSYRLPYFSSAISHQSSGRAALTGADKAYHSSDFLHVTALGSWLIYRRCHPFAPPQPPPITIPLHLYLITLSCTTSCFLRPHYPVGHVGFIWHNLNVFYLLQKPKTYSLRKINFK